MKFKVGDKIYTKADGPIMIILTEQDKSNIANMDPSATKYCEFEEDDYTPEQIAEWMHDA